MKVSLVRPTIAEEGYFLSKRMTLFYFRWMTRYPPMGLPYLAAMLEKHGHTCQIVDAEKEFLEPDQIIGSLRRFRPDCVVINIGLVSARTDFALAERIQAELDVPVVGRGHFVSYYPEYSAKKFPGAYLMRGKSFQGFIHLMEYLQGAGHVDSVEGLSRLEADRVVHNDSEPLLHDVDTLPFPARHLIDNSIYGTILSRRAPFTGLLSSFGCPYGCTYCESRRTPFRSRSPNNVAAEIQECVDRFGIREIAFLDETFSHDMDRAREICDRLTHAGIRVSWSVRTRLDKVDEDLLAKMKRAGCYRIHYGIESLDQEMLVRMNRPSLDLDLAKKIITMTRAQDILAFGFFLMGTPGETARSLEKTVKQAYRLPLDYVQATRFAPIPGTPCFDEILERLGYDPWLRCAEHGGLPEPEAYYEGELNHEVLLSFSSKFPVGFFLRPTHFLNFVLRGHLFHFIRRSFAYIGINRRLARKRRLTRKMQQAPTAFFGLIPR